jgi:transposase
MEQYAGIDVSLESASICVVDATGRIVSEAKVACEPKVLITWFGKLGATMTRIGLEAGPLSQLSSGLQFSLKVGFENSLIGVPFGSFRRG